MARELPRRPRLMDDWGLRLFADPLNGSDKQPFMYFDFKYEEDDRGNPDAKVCGPRIGVNLMTGDKNAAMEFVTDPAGIIVIMNKITEIAEGKIDFWKMATTTLFRGQTKLEKPMEDVGFVIARDAEGVFMGLQMYGREKVKFYFKPTQRYMWIVDKAGQELTHNESSCAYAMSQAYIMRKQFMRIMELGYMDYKESKAFKEKAKSDRFREQNAKGGGTGGGKPWPQKTAPTQAGGQQQGGWGNAPAPASNNQGDAPPQFDSEIPF